MSRDKRYKSVAWRNLRKLVLQRDNFLCQQSKRFGKTRPAEMVHHIFPADEYPHLFYNINNLISLSNIEHNKLHDRESKKMTDEGKKLQQRYKNIIFKNYK
ncbi:MULTISPECIES: HNH endonuclease [Helcococcus]|uniref:HNH endonuclease n=1 Tax=Helcococcus bovis TaxID=3153252 RepID=A0ABW9F7L8_9FIRM